MAETLQASHFAIYGSDSFFNYFFSDVSMALIKTPSGPLRKFSLQPARFARSVCRTHAESFLQDVVSTVATRVWHKYKQQQSSGVPRSRLDHHREPRPLTTDPGGTGLTPFAPFACLQLEHAWRLHLAVLCAVVVVPM